MRSTAIAAIFLETCCALDGLKLAPVITSRISARWSRATFTAVGKLPCFWANCSKNQRTCSIWSWLKFSF